MRRLLPLFAPILALAAAACAPGQEKDSGPVTDAWVRLTPVVGNPSAAYFTLHGGAEDNRLVSVSSPKAASIELHESRMENGVMKMVVMNGVDLPANATVQFVPGGMHGMMFGVAPELKAGDNIPMTFRFAKGDAVIVQADVQSAGGDAAGTAMAENHMAH